LDLVEKMREARCSSTSASNMMNTWFKKRKTKLYTWKSPGDRNRYQNDYILVKQRFRNSIRDVKTLPGADIDSDHNLLVAEVQTRKQAIKNLGRGNQNGIWNESRAKKTM